MNTYSILQRENQTAFVEEITETCKNSLLSELAKTIRDMSQNATYPQMRFANVSESTNPRYTNTENVTFSKVTN